MIGSTTIFEQFTNYLLLGSDRVTFTDSEKQALEAIGLDLDQPLPELLLEASAIFSQLQKTGFSLPTWSLPIHAVNDEVRTACSTTSAHHLQLILNGKYANALPEFIRLLEQQNKEVPPEMLPEIITFFIDQQRPWSAWKDIIGQRGNWLMQQHPRWQYVLPTTDPAMWATGNHDERLSVLRHLRQTYPELALEMLATSWENERSQHQLAFLALFNTRLSIADVSFLSSVLAHPSREIRELAAVLLTKISESPFAIQLRTLLSDCIEFSAEKIQFHLPDEHEVIAALPSLLQSKGLRFNRLLKLTAHSRPQLWEDKSSQQPPEIISLLLDHDYGLPLLSALSHAAVAHGDQLWATSLLDAWLHASPTFYIEPHVLLPAMLDLIEPAAFNALLASALDTHSVADENSPLEIILRHNPHLLHTPVAIALIQQFQTLINTTGRYFTSVQPKGKWLIALGYQCDVEILPIIKKGWDMSAPTWGIWEEYVEKFMEILQFRKAMHEAMQV